MRLTVFSMILFFIILTANCKGGAKISSAECEPIVKKIIESFEKQALGEGTPEEVAQKKQEFDVQKQAILPMLEKECMSGKYDLKCLETLQNIATIQTCKKK